MTAYLFMTPRSNTPVSRSIVSGFFVGKYPCRCGKYPCFVLMVAVVEFDGCITYQRKDPSSCASFGTLLLSVARVCAEIQPFSRR